MIKPIYHRLVYFLIYIAVNIPSYSQGAEYREYLIRISDSLSIELNTSVVSIRTSTIKQLLKLPEDVELYQITDRSNTAISAWYLVRLLDSKQQQMEIADNTGYLEYSQENHSFKIHKDIPTDPLYSDQWYHSKIQAVESWEQYIPNGQIILAIIDTGIDYNHPDLDGSLWINTSEDLNGNGILDSADINNFDDDANGYMDDVIGWDFTDAPRFADAGDYLDPDNDPMDEYFGGHGTKIAGIIGAQTGNSIGVAALTPGASVMNLRAGTAAGFLEEDDVAKAVLYAIDNGARVINMSFGDIVISRFLKDVIEYAYSEGIVVVASSGNSGTDVTHYPSGLPQTISVGASDQSDQIAGFSNWGHTIDLVAPGVDILSTRAGGGYDMVNGTSFSAPMVTAAIGLILSNNPEYSTEQIRNVLKTSADDIGLQGWDKHTGSGRLNMKRASQITKNTTLLVNYPTSGISVASDTLPIVITSIDPDLISLDVSYGLGDDPTDWTSLVSDHQYQVVEDTIAVFAISSIPDTSVIINLSLKTWSGETVEYHSLISIDRTNPVITDVAHINAFDQIESVSLIEFKTDDITSGDIFYRPKGSIDSFEVIHLEYETAHHYHLFNSSGDTEYYIRATNMSGLSSIDDNAGQFYIISGTKENIINEEFLPVNYTLPAGFMLDDAVDFDGDGNYEAVLSEYDEFGAFGPVAIFEFEQNQFVKRYETTFKGIPRSFGDSDNDGKQELLIGYGQQSYLLEADQYDAWPTVVVWSDTGDFWAGRIADLDADGVSEIVGKKGQSFVLLESVGDNQFQQKYIFENPSPGENQLGPPRSEVADLDDDGNLEIYYGDYDGDLIVYENSGNDLFEAGRYVKLPSGDATNYFVSGSLFSSDKARLVAGTHTGKSQLLEHQVEGLYWDYSVLSSTQDNQYKFDQHLYIHGYANVRDFEAGLNAGSITTGQSDYLYLAPYPDLYIFKAIGDSLVPVWYKGNINTNTILLHDFDKNGVSEFYINDGQQIIGFEQNVIVSPRPPSGFEVYPTDTSVVKLHWNQSQGADRYIIYRGLRSDNLSKYDSTMTELTYVDSSVENSQRYYYALQTIDLSFELNQSKLSKTLSAVPNDPPSIDTLLIKNRDQIEVYFSEPMAINTLKAKNFVIHSEDNPTTSAIALLNDQAVLLSFSNHFLKEVNYQLGMVSLRDTNNTPLPDEKSVLSFTYLFDETEKPYVQEWKFENNQSLILTFSVPMNTNIILDDSNYSLEPSGSIELVELVDDSERVFRLQLSNTTYRMSSGVTTYLSFHDLESRQGVLFEEGNRIALVTASETIEDLFVYPQPATAEEGWLMFSNIAEGTSIKIFDVNGHFIINLEELDQNGGVRWNLCDQSGNKVSSGIYIYYATLDNQTKLGKFTIIK
jgi:hypothetical protein